MKTEEKGQFDEGRDEGQHTVAQVVDDLHVHEHTQDALQHHDAVLYQLEKATRLLFDEFLVLAPGLLQVERALLQQEEQHHEGWADDHDDSADEEDLVKVMVRLGILVIVEKVS